ncbi:hypothetical protein COCON_G00194650 [Conger conger]|uniref:Uncharacterized protein n=1 Tax=Conger conger TaxID=82655 RepID=A0A9Q1HP39_CONCO|nr:hypothetical protein COCON_G00194650 [Conger conger]
MHPTLPEHKYTTLHSSSEAIRRACLQTPQLQSNIFASLDETLLARAEALAAVDIAVSQGKTHPFKPDATYHTMNSVPVPCSSNSTVPLAHHHHHHHHHHHQNLEPPDLMDHISSPSLSLMTGGHDGVGGGGGGGGGGLISTSAHPHSHMHGLTHLSHQAAMNMNSPLTHHGLLPGHHGGQSASGLTNNGLPSINDSDTDPRELEAFAERFKQRRIKLGVTQADVGEKIAAIAEKLDLKKNVVRVWFCNQRQKQKRLKFSAAH